ncbi:MAG: hypothetical protein WED04_10400 [Promethearchaeati archaeon SRVP18_Atabeyarchaeia-1]
MTSRYDWLKENCHSCGAKVGDLHTFGCRMETCPTCGRQLITCGHYGDVKKGNMPRIPFIPRILVCAVCGRPFPRFFKVEEDDWVKFVIPPLHHRVLCRRCYDEMRELFPEGWNKSVV